MCPDRCLPYCAILYNPIVRYSFLCYPNVPSQSLSHPITQSYPSLPNAILHSCPLLCRHSPSHSTVPSFTILPYCTILCCAILSFCTILRHHILLASLFLLLYLSYHTVLSFAVPSYVTFLSFAVPSFTILSYWAILHTAALHSFDRCESFRSGEVHKES